MVGERRGPLRSWIARTSGAPTSAYAGTSNDKRGGKPLRRKHWANGPRSKYNETNTDLTGKVVVVTGSNIGIGKETARALGKMRATVVMACRDEKKAQTAIDELRSVNRDLKLEFMPLDVSDLNSVRTFLDQYKQRYNRCDVLVNNAGALFTDRKRSKQGVELTLATNHLGPFLLTNLMLDTLKKSAPSRVVTVSSGMEAFAKIDDCKDLQFEQKKYDGEQAYNLTKLCNILMTEELARRLKPSDGVSAVVLQPGLVPDTGILRDGPAFTKTWMTALRPLIWLFSKDVVSGAQTTIHCATAPLSELVHGAYYADCVARRPRNKNAGDAQLATKLWSISDALASK